MKTIIFKYPHLFIKWILFAVALLFLKVLAIILSPFLSAYSVVRGVTVLPKPWNLFHTHDDTLDGGQHQLGWPQARGFKLFIQRMKWICRNPAYGFAAYKLGYEIKDEKLIYFSSDGKDWDVPWNTSDRYHVYVMEDRNGKRYFGYRSRWKLGSKLMGTWIGWKWNSVDGKTRQLKIAPITKANTK